MPDSDRAVHQFRRRLAAWGALRGAVAAVTLYAFVWGTVALALRAAVDFPALPLLWGAAGIPLAAALAVRTALRRVPDAAKLRALLDRENDCGGLLMADAETATGAWAARVPAVRLPAVRWRFQRPVSMLAASAGYVALALLLPARPAALAGEAPLDIAREADRLAEQVQVLKEEKIVTADKADDMAKRLDELRDRSTGREPAKTLEALDHMADAAKQMARQAAEQLARNGRQSSQLGAAADALQQASAAMSAEDLSAMMADLVSLSKKAADENALVGEELDEELRDALEKGKLGEKQLAKLAACMNAGTGKAKNGAKRLNVAKLINPELYRQCEGECESKCDPKKLCEFLKKNGCKKCLGECLGEFAGRGGVTEGPGHAELNYGDPSSSDGAKFREESLPPSAFDANRDSQTTGLSASAPKQDAKPEAAKAGALAGAAAGGGSADAAEVAPRHRGAVQRYFDRPKQ